jgi:hypothetical protein
VTFPTLHARTGHLTPQQRLGLFLMLPVHVQAHCWNDLASRSAAVRT